MTRITRPGLVGAGLGVVLLALMVVFAVVLPEVDDAAAAGEGGTSAGAAPAAGSVELPPRLGEDLIAVDSGRLPDQLSRLIGDVDRLTAVQDSARAGFEELFEAAAAFRIYGNQDASTVVAVTALAKPAGLFAPQGAPVDAEVQGVARPAIELVEVDGGVCSLNWGRPVPRGQQVDESQPPQTVYCQLGSQGRTFTLTGSGMTAQRAMSLLQEVARAQ